MREFPLDSDTTPFEGLLHDYVDRMLSNDEGLPSDNDAYADKILDSSYEVFNPRQLADSCVHLTVNQRKDLFNLFCKFKRLFDGKLRKYTES